MFGRQSQPRHPDDGWDTEVSSAFALAGFLAVVFVGFTLLAIGPLITIDAFFNIRTPPHAWLPILHILDRAGQRSVCIPILLFFVWVASRESRSWRPLLVVILGILGQNFVVGILKLGLGRGEPETGNPSFFIGGLAYPSGHTSNIVMVYGLIPYLLYTYGRMHRRLARAMVVVVAFLSVMMVVVSLTERWHWFADLIGGLLIGAMVLCLTYAVDHAIPNDIFSDGYVLGVRRMPRVILDAARRPATWPEPSRPEISRHRMPGVRRSGGVPRRHS